MSNMVTAGQWTWVGLTLILCILSLILNVILGFIVLKQREGKLSCYQSEQIYIKCIKVLRAKLKKKER